MVKSARRISTYHQTVSIETIKELTKGRARGSVKVTKVLFTLAGKTVKIRRSAPFVARLRLAPGAASGSTIKVRATAHLKLRDGKARAKTITVGVRAC